MLPALVAALHEREVEEGEAQERAWYDPLRRHGYTIGETTPGQHLAVFVLFAAPVSAIAWYVYKRPADHWLRRMLLV